jgi:hypothetical protein
MTPVRRRRLAGIAAVTLCIGFAVGAAIVWAVVNADRLTQSIDAATSDRPTIPAIWLAPNYCLKANNGVYALCHADDAHATFEGLTGPVARVMSHGRYTVVECGVSSWITVRDDGVLAKHTTKESLSAHISAPVDAIDSGLAASEQWFADHADDR